jgi:methionyl-tRNA formyltransferase
MIQNGMPHGTNPISEPFAFCGNRFFVLEEMLAAGLKVRSIAAVTGSHLETELQQRGIGHIAVGNRSDFLAWLRSLQFDYFVSNGCPYRIPTEDIASGRCFINVHPSYLPDLRGADPVPGAVLLGRDGGATCHLMDENFDTGSIISQIRIPNSADLDALLLYQLSFLAEKEVFLEALRKCFVPAGAQCAGVDDRYFTKQPSDLFLDFSQSADAIVRRVRAFSNRSQGACFLVGENLFRTFDAEVVNNPFLVARRHKYTDKAVVFNVENMIVVRRGDEFVKLKVVTGPLSLVPVGSLLT